MPGNLVKSGGPKYSTVLHGKRKKKKKKTAAIHCELVEVYGDRVMSPKQVRIWYNALANGKTDASDEQRSGRPSTFITNENVCRVDALRHF